MDKVLLQAQMRRPGRHASRELRQADQVPAVIYGQDVETQSIAVEGKALSKALQAAGAGLITLDISGQTPVQVLAREIQRHPTKHNTLHVDFQAVSMTNRLRVTVPLAYQGEAPALETSGLVLVRNMDSIEVECLPQDIPASIVVDLSRLETIEDMVCVEDLAAPEGVKLLSEPGQVIASLKVAAVQPEEEEAEEVEEETEVEVVARGRKAEEEEEEE